MLVEIKETETYDYYTTQIELTRNKATKQWENDKVVFYKNDFRNWWVWKEKDTDKHNNRYDTLEFAVEKYLYRMIVDNAKTDIKYYHSKKINKEYYQDSPQKKDAKIYCELTIGLKKTP